MAGTIQIFTCNQSQRSSEAWFQTQTMKMPPPKLPVFHQDNRMTESSKRAWTTLNTTVKTTEPRNTYPAKCPNSQAFKARTDTITVDSHPLRHLLCTINMRANNTMQTYTTAETTVKAWVEHLVDLAAITGTKVSVRLSDLLDTRAKKTSTDQPTTSKKTVNRAEAHAPNICRNLLRSLQFYRTLKENKNNTLKTSTEASRLFTGKEEPLKSNKTYSPTTRSLWQRLTKRTLKILRKDTGYINKEPEKCQLCTKESCERKSWKSNELITLLNV